MTLSTSVLLTVFLFLVFLWTFLYYGNRVAVLWEDLGLVLFRSQGVRLGLVTFVTFLSVNRRRSLSIISMWFLLYLLCIPIVGPEVVRP